MPPAGHHAVQLRTVPNPAVPRRTAWGPESNRSDEAEKQGTCFAFARRKIWMASASDAAIGLSIKSGLPAAMTGRAWARCGRPSTLSNRMTSTCSSNSGIESTILTPFFRSVSVKPFTRSQLIGQIGAAAGIGRHDGHLGQFSLRLWVIQQVDELDDVRGIEPDHAHPQPLRRPRRQSGLREEKPRRSLRRSTEATCSIA